MLVLSRRTDQAIVFPDQGISIRVLQIKGNMVRLGVTAPRSVSVVRGELLQRGPRRDVAPASLVEAPSASPAAPTLAERAGNAPSQTEARRSAARTALVVDDDQIVRDLLGCLLRSEGFEVATASDGAAALDYLACEPRPDVVLLDMLMPRCDGPATVRAIRGNPAHAGLKILAVSGSSPEAVGVKIGREGVDVWLEKPIDPKLLVCVVERAVQPAG
jgi:carbon storage regulator CsrA